MTILPHEANKLFDTALDVLINVDDVSYHGALVTLTLHADLYEALISAVSDVMRANHAKRA